MSLDLERILGIERYTQLVSEFNPGPQGPQGDPGSGFDGSGQVEIVYAAQSTISGGVALGDVLTYTFAAGDLRTFIDVPLVFVSIISNANLTNPSVKWESPRTIFNNNVAAPLVFPITSWTILTRIVTRVNDNHYISGLTLNRFNSSAGDVLEDWMSLGGIVKLAVGQAIAAPNRLSAKMIVAIVRGVG